MRAVEQFLYKKNETFYLRLRCNGTDTVRSLTSDAAFAFRVYNKVKPSLHALNKISRLKLEKRDSINTLKSKILSAVDAAKPNYLDLKRKIEDNISHLNKYGYKVFSVTEEQQIEDHIINLNSLSDGKSFYSYANGVIYVTENGETRAVDDADCKEDLNEELLIEILEPILKGFNQQALNEVNDMSVYVSDLLSVTDCDDRIQQIQDVVSKAERQHKIKLVKNYTAALKTVIETFNKMYGDLSDHHINLIQNYCEKVFLNAASAPISAARALIAGDFTDLTKIKSPLDLGDTKNTKSVVIHEKRVVNEIHHINTVKTDPVSVRTKAPDLPVLSQVLIKYIEDKNSTSKPFTPVAQNEFEQTAIEIIDILGDRPLENYELHDFKKFEAIMLKVPARYRKSLGNNKKGEPLEYYGMSVLEISKLNHGKKCFSKSTVSQKIQNIQALYVINQIKSPLVNFEFVTKPTLPRSFFTRNEVQCIKEYILNLPDYGKWLFLIAIYTGARLTEITQLLKSDVKFDRESEHWYFSINDEGEKSLKNDVSKRNVPIHKMLLEYGILDWYNSIKTETLFPKKCPEYGAYSAYANQKILKKILEQYSIPKIDLDGFNRVFHSFRHTFIDHMLSTLNVDMSSVKDLVGHDKEMGITGNYSKRKKSLSILKPIIDQFDY